VGGDIRALFLFFLLAPAAFAQPLPALRAQATSLTASGLSSGGYMAIQLHVAHSASVSGAGALAAGPYACAQGSLWAAYWNCMRPKPWAPLPPSALLKTQTDALALSGKIDATKNLAGAPVWLFSGTQDRTVAPEVVKAAHAFYQAYGANSVRVADKPAGHGMPTHDAGRACETTESPFINDCSYDAAGALLSHLLGTLKSPSKSAEGRLLEFEQQPYGGEDIGLGRIGYVYVPRQCESASCRLHVAFHGCRQGAGEVGMRYVSEAGYNRWADTNALIVLYPQAIATWWRPFNPRGCWDWWGYTGPQYATRDGAQIRAVTAMLARLAQ
jgi:poly(3-hydroxybutyrate) depolymerase